MLKNVTPSDIGKFILLRTTDIVIFIIGGVTYEEAKEISLKNK
jgi:hypothetical protein